METEALTLPRYELPSHSSRTRSIIGLGTAALTCVSPCVGTLDSYLYVDVPATGSNTAWLTTVLTETELGYPEDLYAKSLQRLTSVSNPEEVEVGLGADARALLKVKDAFSLTGQQLADAVGATRASVYKWLDGSVTMRPQYRSRLEELHILATFWLERIGKPMARVVHIDGGQRSRFSELLASPAGFAEAREYLESLAGEATANGPRHRSVLEIIKERGWKKLPEHVVRSEQRSRIPSIDSTPDPS